MQPGEGTGTGKRFDSNHHQCSIKDIRIIVPTRPYDVEDRSVVALGVEDPGEPDAGVGCERIRPHRVAVLVDRAAEVPENLRAAPAVIPDDRVFGP